MIARNKNWMLISIGALTLSSLSLFLPVINYTASCGDNAGIRYSFNIVKLLDRHSFVEYVLREYRGKFLYGISAGTANVILVALCLIGAAAIVLSFVGLKCMAKQYESAWPLGLTLAGFGCTVLPALAILITVLMSGDEFYGTMQVGVYAYITPIAMIISCITVTKRHKLTQEELRIQKAASAYIRPAGDLPMR